MYKLWAKAIINNRTVKSIDVTTDDEKLNHVQKRKRCLTEICHKFDISEPIWLKEHDEEFDYYHKITFKKDDFIDEFHFDKLEVELIDDGTEKHDN